MSWVLLLGVPDPVRPRWAPISVTAKGGRHCGEQGVLAARDHGFSASVDSIYFHTVVTASEGVRVAVYSVEALVFVSYFTH